MSTFSRITRHPQTGTYEEATWIDDYFAPHVSGVEFKSDGKVYPTELVERHQLKEFWAQDVIETVETKYGADEVLSFLHTLEHKYKSRWERDPAGGEGAVAKTRA